MAPGRVHQAMVAMDLQVIQSATNTVKRVKTEGWCLWNCWTR